MAAIDDAIEHLRAGRAQEAYQAARAALRSGGADGRALAAFGVAAVQLGRHGEAVEPLKAAAARARDPSTYCSVMIPLARALAALGLWAEAERACSAAERVGLDGPEARDDLGGVLFRIGLAPRALAHFEAAAAARPQRPDFQRDLAMGLVALGRLDEAAGAFERALSLDPLFGVAHMSLADLRRWTPQTAHLTRLRALWADPQLPQAERPSIGFALFKELDDLGLAEEAWPVLEQANAIAADTQASWSEAAEADWTEAMISAFPAGRFAPSPRPAGGGTRPIFIVGLPRSGTTLLERILAAHSGVQAMGEVATFPVLFKQVSGAGGAQLLDAATVRGAAGADWAAVAAAYRRETAYLAAGAAHAVDKQPRNAAYVGAIRLAFPEAVIIHLRRDPMDALMGAFKVYFHGAYEWSYRLADLAAHFRLHSRLMAHWRACLGDAWVEVDYEALTADPEAQIRRLLAACGLEFEPACLHPERAPGAVATASSAQVRNPITRARVGSWRRYERRLEPLRAALAEAGLA
jgi:tetratricopeptide (TPR) repeat protein